MKFIFPQNYDFNFKLFGIIEYHTAILDLIWGGIIFIIINIFVRRLIIKIFLFIIFVLPVAIFSVVGVNGENIFYFILYVIKYLYKPKILLYNKIINYNNER